MVNDENPWSFLQGRVLSLPTGQPKFRSGIRRPERDEFMEQLAEVADKISNDSFDIFEEDSDPVLDVNQWELRSRGNLNLPVTKVRGQQSLQEVVKMAVNNELGNMEEKSYNNSDASNDHKEDAPLPQGWTAQLDSRTGKYYYIDHNTRRTTWENPRHDAKLFENHDFGRNRSVSPVHPKPVPQMGTIYNSTLSYLHGATASPSPITRLHLEDLSTQGSPQSTRSTLRRDSHILADIGEDGEQEQAINQIAAMFPTVDEEHIKDLYKKYHGSQAIVISALQVAKHPITAPGPATVYTPPPFRHSTLPGVASGVLAGITMTGSLPYNFPHNMTPTMGIKDLGSVDQSSGYPSPRPGTAASDFDTSFSMGSPQISTTLFRSFPKPHSSPKMKLRYLKSVFPTVEEYLLLDVLANSENNVQKAADRLAKMGYVKRETPSAPRLHAKKKEEERLASKRIPLPKPPPIKTDKEKEDLRKKLKDRYERKYDIPERILFMALESVLYDEEQANNLITSMIEDDLKRQKAKEVEKAKEKAERKKSPKVARRIVEEPKHTSPKHDPKKTGQQNKKHSKTAKMSTMPRISRGTWTQEEREYQAMDYRSEFKTIAKGPNTSLRKGPNDDLLLTDYITWNGPNPDLRKGANMSLAKGPQRHQLTGPRSLAKGPDSSLAKGPAGLAKGTMYSKGPAGLAKGPLYNGLEEDQRTRSN